MKLNKLFLITYFSLTIAATTLFAAETPIKNPTDEIKIFDAETPERKKIDDKAIFGIILENDLFNGKDNGYTDGIRLSYVSPEANPPELLNTVAQYLPTTKNSKKRYTFALGQSMFTPRDTSTSNPNPQDQPYAGWLYASVGVIADSGKVFDNVMLTLGMVGPASGAEQTQKFVHKNISDSQRPQGWNHQLKNEPGIILTYERKWREAYKASLLGINFDVMPHVGTNLGNINSDAAIGTTFRLGYNLPFDYGPPRIRPSLPGSDFFIPTEKLGGYIFSTFELRAVGRNIFLDGNSFQNSPHVHKNTGVGSAQIGVAATYKDFRISYAQVFLTKEYKEQQQKNRFGSVTLSWRY
jgi:lipid A 3-O-deacylase